MLYYEPKKARNAAGIPITLQQAREMGYTESGELKRQAGYISRRADLEKGPVYIAGKGAQAGKLFYLAPCFDSTRYCFRVYLKKGDGRQ